MSDYESPVIQSNPLKMFDDCDDDVSWIVMAWMVTNIKIVRKDVAATSAVKR